MAKNILSFEEYSKKVNIPNVSEEELEFELHSDEDLEEDIEIEEDGDDEDIEIEDLEDYEDVEIEEDEDDEEEDIEIEEDEVKNVSEMLKEVYESACNEAKSYEKDDYQEHTVESYMNEMATLNASMMAEIYEKACKDVKEQEMTLEMYEAACNSMKEAYAKKMNEMVESYAAAAMAVAAAADK